jgi:hypothetical protein
MPWVKVDDHFPDNRKVSLLSDRAFRLYISALCWSSANLTEGAILARELPVVARVRGVKTAAKELEAAGLWEPTEAGWTIHDYLIYNPDRAKVLSERSANAARQQAWRERKRAEREAKKAAEEEARNARSNGVTNGFSEAPNHTSATRTRHDGDTTERESHLANQPSPQVGEFRNGANNGTPSRPVPKLSPTEKAASKGAGPQVPDFAAELVEQMTAAGMVVGWRLGETEWFAVHAHIKRCGVQALVEFSRRRWNPADPPQTARYLTRIWSDLPSLPDPAAGLPALRSVDAPPSSTDRYLADMAAHAERLRHTGGA